MPRYLDPYDPLLAGSIDCTDSAPHDRAIVRALCSAHKFRPPKHPERKDSEEVADGDRGRKKLFNPLHVTKRAKNTVFVARLSPKTDDEDLRKVLSKFGDIRECRVVRDIVTGMSRLYGFVEFKHQSEAQRCYNEAHGMVIHDKQVLVDWEFGRTLKGWIPRRLGGGFGGRKESGQLRFGCRDRRHRKPLLMPSATAEVAPIRPVPRENVRS